MAIVRKRKVQKEYVKAVFLDYISKHPETDESNCPFFLKDELQIANIKAYAQRLVRGGYLREENRKYALTDRGQRTLEECSDYLRFFFQGTTHLTILEYVAQKGERDASSFPVVMGELFAQKLAAYTDYSDMDSLKDLHQDLGSMYEEQGLTDKALYQYMSVLYYDTSGLEYVDSLRKYIERKRSREKTWKSFDGIYIRPEVRRGIGRTRAAYQPEMIDEVYAAYPMEYHLCSKEKFDELMQDIMFNAAMREAERAAKSSGQVEKTTGKCAAKSAATKSALDEKAWQEYFAEAFAAELTQAKKKRVKVKPVKQ